MVVETSEYSSDDDSSDEEDEQVGGGVRVMDTLLPIISVKLSTTW